MRIELDVGVKENLVGFKNGRIIYNKQLKNVDTDDIVIVIPQQIQRASFTFIQGLFFKYSKDYIEEHIKIEGPDHVVSKCWFTIRNIL